MEKLSGSSGFVILTLLVYFILVLLVFWDLNLFSGESQVMAAAGYGIPKWSKFIKDKIINSSDGDYTLLHDLTRGVGYGVLDWDVAASVQAVFTDIVFSLN